MALEIERRFLVRGSEWRRHVTWEADLEQAYLACGPADLVLRVRLSRAATRGGVLPETKAWLTVKASSGEARARLEFEYPIPARDAEAMVRLSGRRIRKRRHGLDLAGGEWVLDLFEEANAPLVVAEVELSAANQVVAVPDWCWREVTDRRDLSNAALATRPLRLWEPSERRDLLGLEDAESAIEV